MKSTRRGKNTSAVEVSNISAHGFWLLIGEREDSWTLTESMVQERHRGADTPGSTAA